MDYVLALLALILLLGGVASLLLLMRANVSTRRAEGKTRMAELDAKRAENRLASKGKGVDDLLKGLEKESVVRPSDRMPGLKSVPPPKKGNGG